ncbi:putative U3 small nucleolar RNA-associated protein 7 [Paratrimastix pyriformis]|uniref:U3 small nucleolar RNA-associated protein 7 n=1 Tax=Paratrimastix pyriformis TaxID=342808 RepID=A0ABQ8USG7_9EUKA|nr:putative U3 small nucleolar RNA-associated protein 7 [Paratrimastix pyriformis]
MEEPPKQKKSTHKKKPEYLRGVENKKLKAKLVTSRKQRLDVNRHNADSNILLEEDPGYLVAEGMERTYKFRQSAIRENIDINAQKKALDLKLNTFGPYFCDYSRNGRPVLGPVPRRLYRALPLDRFLLLGGAKGHVFLCDLIDTQPQCEFHVRETIRDVKMLQNESIFAVAQRKYVHLYDKQGLEVQVIREHIQPTHLEFLPYHFLLASVGTAGVLKYHDVSTGRLVAQHPTHLGESISMCQNPHNAVMLLGHANGTVTMWTPNMAEPVVKMLTHAAPVQAIGVDNAGRYLATAGLDGLLSIWDVRTYRKLHSYHTPSPVSHLDISQRGMLAVSFTETVQVWRDALATKASAPYMNHRMAPRPVTPVGTAGANIIPLHVSGLRFQPFDDALGIAHAGGFSSIVVPGSGEPNYDTFEADPFESSRAKRNTEVRQLLDKIPAEMITLNPAVLTSLRTDPHDEYRQKRHLQHQANDRKSAAAAASAPAARPAATAGKKTGSAAEDDEDQPDTIAPMQTEAALDAEDKEGREGESEAEEAHEAEAADEGEAKAKATDEAEAEGEGEGEGEGVPAAAPVEAGAAKAEAPSAPKKKRRTRGRSTALKRFLERQKNIITHKKLDVEEHLAKQKERQEADRAQAQAQARGLPPPTAPYDPLARFKPKRRT